MRVVPTNFGAADRRHRRDQRGHRDHARPTRARKRPARPGSRRTRRSGRRGRAGRRRPTPRWGPGPPPVPSTPTASDRFARPGAGRAGSAPASPAAPIATTATAKRRLRVCPDVCRRSGQRAPRTGVAARSAAPDSGSSPADRSPPPTAASRRSWTRSRAKPACSPSLLSTERPARFAVLLRRLRRRDIDRS